MSQGKVDLNSAGVQGMYALAWNDGPSWMPHYLIIYGASFIRGAPIKGGAGQLTIQAQTSLIVESGGEFSELAVGGFGAQGMYSPQCRVINQRWGIFDPEDMGQGGDNQGPNCGEIHPVQNLIISKSVGRPGYGLYNHTTKQ